MERNKKKAAGGVVRGRGVLRKIFEFYALLATRFSCAYSELDDGKDGVRVLRALRCLRRELFTYFTSKNVSSRFYAFRIALFGLSVFYAD